MTEAPEMTHTTTPRPALTPARGLALGLILLGLGFGLFAPESTRNGERRVGPRRAGARRIIAHTPALSELVVTLGGRAELVGVSDFCTGPALTGVAKIGGVRVNLESVHRLAPTDILLQTEHKVLRAYAEETGAKVHRLQIEDLATLRAAIAGVGELLDAGAAAKAEQQRIDGAFAAVRERSRQRGDGIPCLLAVGRRPGKLGEILTTTRGFLTEAVEACGGRNLFAELTAPYPRINLEAVMARRPALIVELHGARLSEAERAQLRQDWLELAQKTPDFPAPTVAIIDGPRVLIPGPGVTATLQLIEARFEALDWPRREAAAGDDDADDVDREGDDRDGDDRRPGGPAEEGG